MKRLKKFVTLFTLAAVCFAIPGLGKITVKAAEPTTYVLNYSDSSSEWRYKEASTMVRRSSGPRVVLSAAEYQRR